VQWNQSNLFLYDELLCNLSVSMCVIGSLICNQNDKLRVIFTILFLQWGSLGQGFQFSQLVLSISFCFFLCPFIVQKTHTFHANFRQPPPTDSTLRLLTSEWYIIVCGGILTCPQHTHLILLFWLTGPLLLIKFIRQISHVRNKLPESIHT